MKKLFLIITFFCMLLLASCDPASNNDDIQNDDGASEDQGGKPDNGEGEQDGNEPAAPLIWNPDTYVYFISNVDREDRLVISDKFATLTENYLMPHSEDKDEKDHELVVGPAERSVSQAAYELLERNLTEYDDGEGYVVLVKDGSVAVAYSSDAAYDVAMNAFYENCCTPEYYAYNGPVCWDFYSLRERAEQNREAMYDEEFARLGQQLAEGGAENAEEIVKELRKYYSLIKTEQIYWLADLYEPESGAFYHCNSARDAEGYLPDLESTNQAFLMLDRGGLFRPIGRVEGGTADLPDFIVEPLSRWIKSLQSSEDGFFYHPQWSTVGTSRRGRDLDNAVTLFRIVGAQPYYDDPSGRMKGSLGAPGPNAVKPASALTSRLGISAVTAVSAITPTASTLPAYLQSIEACEAYLEGLKINDNNQSYYKGNELAAQWSLIKAAGKEYEECVINYLNRTQIPETGLWEYQNEIDYDPSDKVGYNGTNGLMKICVLYGSLGYAVPNAYNALQSVIKVGLYPNTDPRDESVCYTLNIWTCLGSMMRNIKNYDPDNYPAAQRLLAENIPAILRASYDLQHTHLMPDGGFKYYERMIMNGITGCASAPESDTDSTMVATTSTVNNIFSTLKATFGNITEVHMWCHDDYYVFMGELEKRCQ